MTIEELNKVLEDESLLVKKARQYRINPEIYRKECQLARDYKLAILDNDAEKSKKAMQSLVEYQKEQGL